MTEFKYTLPSTHFPIWPILIWCLLFFILELHTLIHHSDFSTEEQFILIITIIFVFGYYIDRYLHD